MGAVRTYTASVVTLWLWSTTASAAPTPPLGLTHPLAPAEGCLTCHAFPNLPEHQSDPRYSPAVWQGSMMANAARDPVFWAGVAIAHQDEPTETETCVRCHAPAAFLAGRGDAISIDALSGQDLEGVGCELCHRMIDDGETPPGNAQYVIDDVDMGGIVPRRGPWTYQDPGPFPDHPWSAESEFLASSALCGTCHDVSTARERVDDEGAGMGVPFNEQRTYREWLNSEFSEPGPSARTCQDCHLPAVDEVAGCAAFNDAGATHPTGGVRHELAGANRFMISLLRDQYGSAGSGEIADAFFDTSLEATDRILAQAATMTVEFPDTVDLEIGIPTLGVRVENQTGHKLPSGYSEGRVMWLEVIARYEGAILWSSGRWDEDTQTIEDDPQARRYEGIAERYSDGSQLHILRSDHWISDTRIPPRGLIQDLETDPVGDRYLLGPDQTWPAEDQVDYTFDPIEFVDQTAAADDELEISVRLLYLVNSPDYIAFLKDENVTNGSGSAVSQQFSDAGGATPVVLAQASQFVPLTGLLEDEGGTQGDPQGCGCSTERSIPGSPLWLCAIIGVFVGRRSRNGLS